ncbi:MAG: transposase [Vicinamibacterales bacterium]
MSGLLFHLMNRAAKRATLFEGHGDYEAFIALLRHAAKRLRVAIYAYCVMPNHWHLIASARDEGGISRFMHWLTTTHARRWQLFRGTDGQGAVYQGRFRAVAVAEDRHFLWVCRYVERNAVRASLVARAEDWQWSSLGARVRNGDIDWLATWPVPQPPGWVEHVNLPQTAAELAAFRSSVRRGEPYGDAEWSARIAQRTGRNCSRRPRGRPKRTVLFK